MILKDEDVEARLSSPKNLLNALRSQAEVKDLQKGGRGEGDKSIPDKVRELIGSFRGNGESQTDIAEVFGISQPVVSELGRGLVHDRLSPSLVEANEKGNTAEDKIDEGHSLALDCLVESLGLLKPQLKGISNPKTLSKIATDMSKIAGSVRGDDKGGITNNTKVIIFTPPQKQLKDFDFIEA